MVVKICDKCGHSFDSDVTPECPYCYIAAIGNTVINEDKIFEALPTGKKVEVDHVPLPPSPPKDRTPDNPQPPPTLQDALKFGQSLHNALVNHPSHYTDGKIEVIDFIDDKRLNFCRGNAVKYIARAGKKDPNKEVQDLEKAVWYLQHEIAKLKGRQLTT